MKEEQHQSFDELFQMGFEDFAPTPSAHLWDNIEKELPLPSEDQVFRNSFANFEVEPSPVVWQNVQRRLPINLMVRRHLTMLSRIAAVLLIGMFGLMTFDQFTSSPEANGYYGPTAEGSTVTTNEVSEKIVSSETVETSEVTPKQTNTARLTLAQTTPTNTQRANVVFVNNGNAEKSDISTTIDNNNNSTFTGRNTEVNKVKVLNGKPLHANGMTPIASVMDDIKSFDEVLGENRKVSLTNGTSMSFNGIPIESMGSGIDLIENAPSGEFKADEMVNPKGFYATVGGQTSWSAIFKNAALREQIGAAANEDLGGNIGLNVSGGYILNDQWSIETEANINRFGQRYREINQGERNTNVKMTYLQLPIMGKYQVSQLSKKSADFSLMAGAQFNSLIGAPSLKTTLNGELVDSPLIDENSLAKNELGLMAGFEVNFQMTDKLSIIAGARASAGKDITKLFAADSQTNTQLGINVGANFQLTK